MTCLQYKALIDEFVDNELAFELSQDFKEHLSSCESCKKELDLTIHLKELLKNKVSLEPGEQYFVENQDLIIARTVEKDSWEQQNDSKTSEKIYSEFTRALLSAVAALLIFAISIVIGTSDSKFTQINPKESPVFVMNPVESMISNANSPIFTKAEQINHIQGMLLISPPGMLGRLAVIHEYNRVLR